MNISLVDALLRLCLTISPSLSLPSRFFIPSKPRLPPFSRNFSAPSFCQPAYCADRTLKYSHSKFRPRRDKGSEFKFPSALNVHVPLIHVRISFALCEHIVRFLHEISKQSVKTGRFSTAFDFLRSGNSFERVLIQAELTLEFHGWETVVHPRLAIYRGIVVYWRSSIVIYQAKNSMLYYLPRTIENTWLLVKFNLQFQ